MQKPGKNLGEIKIDMAARIKVYEELLTILRKKLRLLKQMAAITFFCPYLNTVIREKIWHLKVEIDAKTMYIVELMARGQNENKPNH